MAHFKPKTKVQVKASLKASILAKTPLSDILAGSVLDTLSDAVAEEDYEQYFQMIQLLEDFSLDSSTGQDIDRRASEILNRDGTPMKRRSATNATGQVTITDSAVTPVTGVIAAYGAGEGSLFSAEPVSSIGVGIGTMIINFVGLPPNIDNVEPGDRIAVTGCTSAANNGTFVVISVNDTAPGSITATNAAAVAEAAPAGATATMHDYTLPLSGTEALSFGPGPGFVRIDRFGVNEENINYVSVQTSKKLTSGVVSSLFEIDPATHTMRLSLGSTPSLFSSIPVGGTMQVYQDANAANNGDFTITGKGTTDIMFMNMNAHSIRPTAGSTFRASFQIIPARLLESRIGDSFIISGASNPANNSGFTISAVGASETILGAQSVYAMRPMATAGLARVSFQTLPARIQELFVGDQVTVAAAASTENNGSYTITAFGEEEEIVHLAGVSTIQNTAGSTFRLVFDSIPTELEYVSIGDTIVLTGCTFAHYNGSFAITAINLVGQGYIEFSLPSGIVNVSGITNTAGPTWRYTFSSVPSWMPNVAIGSRINVLGATNAANNGIFQITGFDSNVGWVEVSNAAGVAEGAGSVVSCYEQYSSGTANIDSNRGYVEFQRGTGGGDEVPEFGSPGNLTVVMNRGWIEFSNAAGVLEYESPAALAVQSNRGYIDFVNAAGVAETNSGSALVDFYFDNIASLVTLSEIIVDHGAAEPVILSTVGDRTYAAGAQVVVPATPTQAEITYTTTQDWIIYDGESQATGVPVACDLAGTIGNIQAEEIKSFKSLPFATAQVTNPNSFTNALDDETDPEFISRIKRRKQTISAATRDAIEDASLGVTDPVTEQQVLYAQYVEDEIAANPGMLYIDDGEDFPAVINSNPTETLITTAIGGEDTFYLRNYPLVNPFASNAITITKNPGNHILVRGTDYKMNPLNGTIKLMGSYVNGLSAGDSLSVAPYSSYGGLIALTQWTIDGKRDDRQTYPGVRAAGVQIQVLKPTFQDVQVIASVITEAGIAHASVVPLIVQALQNYVSGLDIGKPVIYAEIVAIIQSVSGVYDVTVELPTANTVIPDGVKARLTTGNISIG